MISQDKASFHLFATVGSRTERGGWVAKVSSETQYCGLLLARVGDIVRYPDGSEAFIVDGAGFAATWDDKPFALVGSRLSNGDCIARTLQDEAGVRVNAGESIDGLFDPHYVPPPRALSYRLAVKGATTARGGVLREPTSAWDLAGTLGKVATVGDFVEYPDGSKARVTSGVRIAHHQDVGPFAFVGSKLENGDTITDSPERAGLASSDTFTIIEWPAVSHCEEFE
ncbi:PAAR domain-containing protein [Burkholderia multivorans]|uniref:PAAR domain-containing protein n=1 Tax=Burkholderia multivorans TaxID=87883 RepID=UPI000CFEDD24|nr:PAAR domain-containing protein [Burkholderia multivorans]MBR8450136.1 PAAR domain-containing protein [Burkholderia multivorans]MBU9446433.1 PAAR domain-containing protein [Burkholderia multivorans]MCL4642653.1 PAAR domain-containing protein [Burkholderia multivorans]PRG35207.1 hypothetical protein C6T68_19020 [Burkholderia multivorans]UQN86736.1 PAAR domain-containing protein [Burkholderia multivorans]